MLVRIRLRRSAMKKLATLVIVVLMTCAYATASKPCEELRGEIAKKLDDKGVKGYTLEIVPKDQDAEKVVGTCEGGSKKIVYNREGASASAEKPAAKAEKPAAKKAKD